MPKFDEIRHPDYVRMQLRWMMARSFSRGGIHVLQPDYAATVGWSAESIPLAQSSDADPAAGGDSLPADLGRDESRYKWNSTSFNSFLWKHRRETKDEFDERGERAIHIPLFLSMINIFSAGILRKPPRYENGIPTGGWLDYTTDVDLCGTGMPAFRRLAMHGAQTYGRYHAITDRPSFDTDAESLAEQQERGERPYSYLVSPLDLVDWETDLAGKFEWVRIAEPYIVPRDPSALPNANMTQYRIWYRDHWELYQPVIGKKADGGQEYELAGEGPHPVGHVPLCTLNLSREGIRYGMACESPLSEALDMDRYILNALSELDEMERAQAFAILFVPGQRRGPIDIGPFRAIGGEDVTNAPQYISPPSELANSKWERIVAKLWSIKQYLGAGRGLAEFSKEERSGEALNIETEDKRNQMSLWAAAEQEFENGLYQDAAAWSGNQSDDTMPVVVYPDNFDIKSLTAQIQDLVAIVSSKAGIIPHEVGVKMATTSVERFMRESGAGDEEIGAVQKIMKSFAETKPDMPSTPVFEAQEEDTAEEQEVEDVA